MTIYGDRMGAHALLRTTRNLNWSHLFLNINCRCWAINVKLIHTLRTSDTFPVWDILLYNSYFWFLFIPLPGPQTSSKWTRAQTSKILKEILDRECGKGGSCQRIIWEESPWLFSFPLPLSLCYSCLELYKKAQG